MPRSAAAAPRQMLPPPTTTPISVPSSLVTSRICREMLESVAESMMPPVRSPISASPLIFNRTRRYCATLARRPVARFADGEATEAAHANRLAELGNVSLDQVFDGDAGISDEWLRQEGQLTHPLGLARRHLVGRDVG